jgi:hypothetical protein
VEPRTLFPSKNIMSGHLQFTSKVNTTGAMEDNLQEERKSSILQHAILFLISTNERGNVLT